MGQSKEDGDERFSDSTKRKYGVVDDEIPEGEIYRHDEQPIQVSQFKEDGKYWLHLGSRVGLDSTIMFDGFRWDAGEYGGTLWFFREVEGGEVTVGNLDFHPATPMRKLGLVGEWFAENINLNEYRSGVECPKCMNEVLHIGMHSTCENIECDFYCEGHLVEESDRND